MKISAEQRFRNYGRAMSAEKALREYADKPESPDMLGALMMRRD